MSDGSEQHPHDGRVEQHGEREAEAELPEARHAARR